MPDMFEIYRGHAKEYDELVAAEDYEDNLGKLLRGLVNWQGASVLEAGVGTGRVTKLYIEEAARAVCCDQSAHMLNWAAKALAAHEAKLAFHIADNLALPDFGTPFDVFIEGWSFGHAAAACADEDEIRLVAGKLLDGAAKNLKPGGRIVLIETMGTNKEAPLPPMEKLDIFYRILVQEHGFKEHVVRTDYRFGSNEEAVEKMGFFFGVEMKKAVLARGTAVIPEWTGVWVR